MKGRRILAAGTLRESRVGQTAEHKDSTQIGRCDMSRRCECNCPVSVRSYEEEILTLAKVEWSDIMPGVNDTEREDISEELRAGAEVAAELALEAARRWTLEQYDRSVRIPILTGVVRDYDRLRRVGPLISQNGAARVLSVSGTQVRRLIEEGKLTYLDFPALKEGGVTLASLEALRKQRVKQGLEDASLQLRRLVKEEERNTNERDKQ